MSDKAKNQVLLAWCFAINVLYFSLLIVCHTHLFVFGTQLRHSMHLFEAECVVF